MSEITGEQLVRIATQLYRMRSSAKFLYGDKYAGKMEEFKPFVLAHMKKYKCKDEIVAAMEMSHLIAKETNSEATIMLLFAAAIEIIENKD